MRGLPSILSLFRNKFNKFNNTREQMLDSIYHMTNCWKPLKAFEKVNFEESKQATTKARKITQYTDKL